MLAGTRTFVRQPQTHARLNKAIACTTAGAAFAVTPSVPRLNRSSRMSTSSLLLVWLAWLSFICTSLADADVVAVTTAGTTSKCLDTCRTAGDGICQEMRNGSDPGVRWMVDGRSGDWCELGTDCADCAACCNGTSITGYETRSWCDCAPPPRLVPATRYNVSFYVSGIDPFDWRRWSEMEAGLRSYLQCFEPNCTAMVQYTDTAQAGVLVEAVVMDATGNGSSTATVERAAALSQESEAGLFKALAVTVEGPVTASAPRMVMVQVSPLAHAPSTAPPPEPEALVDDPPTVLDCDDPSGGRRRISSTSSHRRLSQIACEGDQDTTVAQAIVAAVIAILILPILILLILIHKQRGMQRSARLAAFSWLPHPQQPAPAIELAVGDAA